MIPDRKLAGRGGASGRPASTRRYLRTAAILGLSGGLLAFFLRGANLRQVWDEMGRARVDFLALAGVATALMYLVRVGRWQVLLRPVGRTRLRTAFRATVIGFAASALLPGRPGEVLRPYLLARQEGLSASAAFATILVERLLDLVTVLLLFGVFLTIFDPGLERVNTRVFGAIKLGGAIGAGGALVALMLAFALAGHPGALLRATCWINQVLPARVATVLSRLVRAFAVGLGTVRRPGALAGALALSAALWLLIAIGIWAVTRAFHLAVPFTGSFLLLVLLVVGVALPTPGAVGGFHAAFQIGTTTFYGAPNDRAVAAAIVLHAISFVPIAILGAVFMAQEGLSPARMDQLVPMPGLTELPGGAGTGSPGSAGTVVEPSSVRIGASRTEGDSR